MPFDRDIESVKTALSSPETCTSATIEDLSRLLDGSPAKERETTKASTARAAKGTAPSKTKVKPRGLDPAAVATKSQGVSATTCELSSLERVKLATEVINICLKTLSQAVLSAGAAKKVESPKKKSTAAEPLSSRSLNLPTKPTKSVKNSEAKSKENGIDGVAQCARIALGSLRKHNDQSKTQALPQLQVESAMSALVAKLIALELIDPACREVRVLARRLGMGASFGQGETTAKMDSSAGPTMTSSLAEFLHLDHLPDSPIKLSLVFTTQIHVLRLLRFAKSIPDPFDLHKVLDLASQGSPYNLLEALIPVDGKEKCTRSLGGLAHAISSVSDRISSRLGNAFDEKLDAAHGVLKLRVLSLRILCRSWDLAGHTIDVNAQLFYPFKRHVEGYLSQTKVSTECQFDIIESACKEFSSITCKLALSGQQKQDLDSAFLDLDQTLHRCSLSTGKQERSQELANAITTRLSEVKIPGIRKASSLCQLATIMVQREASIPKKEVDKVLKQSLHSYTASAEGSSQDLDDLLASVSSLRKAAITSIREELTRQSGQKPDPDRSSLLRDSVLKAPAFVLWYLGSPTKDQKAGTSSTRYERRKLLALKVGRATIESVVTLVKLDTQMTSKDWKMYERSLVDCHTLQERLVIDDMSDNADSPRKQSPVSVIMSNAYWSRYLTIRQGSKSTSETSAVLESAVRLLQDLPIEQQELGLFPHKLERLAYSQEQNKDWQKASETYRRAFHYLFDSGMVETAAKKLHWTPRLASLLQDDKLKLVGKAVDGFCRTITRLDNHDILSLSSTKMQPALHGFVLELELASLRKQCGENDDSTRTTVEHLGQKMLDIYVDDHFPIRRLRAATSLMQCGVFLDSEERFSENNETLGDDERLLLPFHDHLVARRNAILGMRVLANSKLLSTALKQWISLVNGKAAVTREALQLWIDDLEEWLSLLTTIIDYAEAHGLTEQRVNALDLLIYIDKLLSSSSSDGFVLHASSLATELVDMGFSKEAQSLLLLSKTCLADATDVEASTYCWQIAQVISDIDTGNDNDTENLLASAGLYLDTISKHGARSRSIDTLSKEGQYHFVCARHHFRKGSHETSTYHIKQSVRLLLQAWSITERRYGNQAEIINDPRGEQDSSNIDITEDPENSMSTDANIPSIKGKSSQFWGLVRPLFETLMLAAKISSFAGLLPESRYYILEAVRIAGSLPATILQIRAFLAHSLIESMSGDKAAGRHLCGKAKSLLESCRSLEPAQAALLDAERTISLSFCTADEIEEGLNNAYRLVDGLQAPKLLSLRLPALGMTEVERKFASLEISTGRRAKPRSNVSKPTKINGKAMQGNATSLSINTCEGNGASTHNQLKTRLLLAKAQVLTNKQQLSEAIAIQEQLTDMSNEFQNNLQQAIITTKLHLEQGLSLLESDPILNIIPEATLSYPNATSSAPPPKPTKTSRGGRKDGLPNQRIELPNHFAYFSQALKNISAAQSPSLGRPSALQGHQIADLRLKGHLALAAVAPSKGDTEDDTDSLIRSLEHGRNHASLLGHTAIQVEKQFRSNVSVHRSSDLAEDYNTGYPCESQRYRSSYIDIIPSSWNVVSVSLSENRNELRISSFKAKSVPLILSVPLNRQAKDGTDLDFSFDYVKKELQRIIDLANFSTHEGADLAKKGAKAEWWEARAALDSKLGDLLTNIENIWLGGFKGILKYCAIDANLAASFELAFAKILDNHLPSRQARKNRKTGPVKLDSRILELFIRLGQPSKPNNIDEPILDLLYFIVDILWFNGEHNVCDEIDFDPIVIEVRSALSTYHEAVESAHSSHTPGHTILILDKRLHSFPWESLPCMEDQSVCRLPSLYFLRQRILQMHQTDDIKHQNLVIDGSNGTYILNPSGDLKSTLSTFKSPLSSLTTWSSHISSEPSENDIATALSTKSLYVYFGHGSGGQYIRSRTIRRLDHCAVTLLMGCSSASWTEAGEYESYSTALNYLHAGAPAVLGTLWDVTDKDIDRLSLKMLQDWGLFDRADIVDYSKSPIKRNARDKGGQKGKQKERAPNVERRSSACLDDAVAQARSACLMRYLNGAAVVVYGIPISLR